MIERVARAIAKAAGDSPDLWPNFEHRARAAIEAMREPTEEMRKAGYKKGHESWDGHATTSRIWQAMIDAALKTGK